MMSLRPLIKRTEDGVKVASWFAGSVMASVYALLIPYVWTAGYSFGILLATVAVHVPLVAYILSPGGFKAYTVGTGVLFGSGMFALQGLTLLRNPYTRDMPLPESAVTVKEMVAAVGYWPTFAFWLTSVGMVGFAIAGAIIGGRRGLKLLRAGGVDLHDLRRVR